MDNIFTYLKFRGDLDFKAFPFNEVDAAVFATLVALDYKDVIKNGCDTIAGVAHAYMERDTHDERDEELQRKEALLYACAASKRFGSILMQNYVEDISEEEEKTFYALTFLLSKRNYVVVYRGTAGSLISWKENFNTLYEMPTPGQAEALRYLSEVARKPFARIKVIGHSKGGNLAVYAGMCLEEKLQKKITGIYPFDAPGFCEDIEEKLGYQRIKDRIRAFVPVGCVIGNFMKPPYERTVVTAEGVGVYQHDLFNWEAGPYEFSHEVDTNLYSTGLSKTVNDWIDAIPVEDRKRVVDELFEVCRQNGIMHIVDLMHIDLKKIIGFIKCLSSLSPENRALLSIIIKQLKAPH